MPILMIHCPVYTASTVRRRVVYAMQMHTADLIPRRPFFLPVLWSDLVLPGLLDISMRQTRPSTADENECDPGPTIQRRPDKQGGAAAQPALRSCSSNGPGCCPIWS